MFFNNRIFFLFLLTTFFTIRTLLALVDDLGADERIDFFFTSFFLDLETVFLTAFFFVIFFNRQSTIINNQSKRQSTIQRSSIENPESIYLLDGRVVEIVNRQSTIINPKIPFPQQKKPHLFI